MIPEWHTMETEEVVGGLKTNKKGLSVEEAQRRLQEFGPNELIGKKGITPFQIFLGQFKDIFVIMLLVAIAISMLIGEMIEASIIGAIVVLNSVVGFYQEYRSEKAMEATIPMLAKKGRASYLGERSIGHQDPGATSSYYLFVAALEAIRET